MIQSLARESQLTRLTVDGTNYQLAAGTTDVNSGWYDTRNFDSAVFELAVGAIAAGGAVTAKLQYSTDGSTSAGDIEGSSQALADTDDQKVIEWDVLKIDPGMPYIRVATVRGDGGNSALDSLTARGYNGRKVPTTAHATTVREVYGSPIGGTA